MLIAILLAILHALDVYFKRVFGSGPSFREVNSAEEFYALISHEDVVGAVVHLYWGTSSLYSSKSCLSTILPQVALSFTSGDNVNGDNIVFAEIDCSHLSSLCRSFGASSTPALVVFAAWDTPRRFQRRIYRGDYCNETDIHDFVKDSLTARVMPYISAAHLASTLTDNSSGMTAVVFEAGASEYRAIPTRLRTIIEDVSNKFGADLPVLLRLGCSGDSSQCSDDRSDSTANGVGSLLHGSWASTARKLTTCNDEKIVKVGDNQIIFSENNGITTFCKTKKIPKIEGRGRLSSTAFKNMLAEFTKIDQSSLSLAGLALRIAGLDNINIDEDDGWFSRKERLDSTATEDEINNTTDNRNRKFNKDANINPNKSSYDNSIETDAEISTIANTTAVITNGESQVKINKKRGVNLKEPAQKYRAQNAFRQQASLQQSSVKLFIFRREHHHGVSCMALESYDDGRDLTPRDADDIIAKIRLASIPPLLLLSDLTYQQIFSQPTRYVALLAYSPNDTIRIRSLEQFYDTARILFCFSVQTTQFATVNVNEWSLFFRVIRLYFALVERIQSVNSMKFPRNSGHRGAFLPDGVSRRKVIKILETTYQQLRRERGPINKWPLDNRAMLFIDKIEGTFYYTENAEASADILDSFSLIALGIVQSYPLSELLLIYEYIDNILS